ncbi:MAG: DUF937 domain-containing protein [Actinobacteria bacterium]|nr:DUF937 domain-containing protein [Actinomycetota bacterium]
MSLIEDILTKAAGSVLGGGDSDKEKIIAALVPVVIALLADGGLEKVLEKMKGMGLGDEAKSWVDTGENKSISADQAAEIVGSEDLGRIASQIGLPEAQTAEVLAKALPLAVDQASPDGSEPPADAVASILQG